MSTTRTLIALSFAAAALVGGAAVVGCDSGAVKELAPTDSGAPYDAGAAPTDGGGDGGPDCFMNPKTHFEIINACTDAKKITKNPDLPLLLEDGGLPPLP